METMYKVIGYNSGNLYAENLSWDDARTLHKKVSERESSVVTKKVLALTKDGLVLKNISVLEHCVIVSQDFPWCSMFHDTTSNQIQTI